MFENILHFVTILTNFFKFFQITITSSNIYDPCYLQGYCYFVSHYGNWRDKELSGMTCVQDDANPRLCLRVNLKPASESCDSFDVSMAVINPGRDSFWFGVAFRSPEEEATMVNAFLVYCWKDKGADNIQINHGLIEERSSARPICLKKKNCQSVSLDLNKLFVKPLTLRDYIRFTFHLF